MKRIIALSFVALLGMAIVSSCGTSQKKCNGKKGTKTSMGRM